LSDGAAAESVCWRLHSGWRGVGSRFTAEDEDCLLQGLEPDRSREEESFDFLGFTFRPRRARNRRGEYFASFSLRSVVAAKTIRQTMRRSWRIRRRTDKSLNDLANMFNPELRGWICYYGATAGRLVPVFRPSTVR